jgi:23S rRNA (cytidine2498-2'-O)-methyltransferase
MSAPAPAENDGAGITGQQRATHSGMSSPSDFRIPENSTLCTCQAGYEPLLVRETDGAGQPAAASGPGWAVSGRSGGSGPGEGPQPELAFAHAFYRAPAELRGESVNALAQRLLDFFLAGLGGERVEGPWPCLWQAPAEPVGLGRRATAVEGAFAELLRRRMSRVSRLASASQPRSFEPIRGFFVRFVDFDRAFASTEAFFNGQRRMADDPLAPSRSYLKVEEAYGLLGCEPMPGESVVDLGAAPGGWSYSAARRGARVLAVDNGPLKGGALGNPLIEHIRADAFGFRPPAGPAVDWLFCDLVEEPHHTLRNLITPWLAERRCRIFIVNLKFGRADPLELLQQLRSPGSPFVIHGKGVRIRHLFHNREEFTVAGRCDLP